jgi:hypothetical protein
VPIVDDPSSRYDLNEKVLRCAGYLVHLFRKRAMENNYHSGCVRANYSR